MTEQAVRASDIATIFPHGGPGQGRSMTRLAPVTTATASPFDTFRTEAGRITPA